jgi:hypothetical protein
MDTFIIDAAIGILLPRQQLFHLGLSHLLSWGGAWEVGVGGVS